MLYTSIWLLFMIDFWTFILFQFSLHCKKPCNEYPHFLFRVEYIVISLHKFLEMQFLDLWEHRMFMSI